MHSIEYLRTLLTSLPSSLPWSSAGNSVYRFGDFSLDEEYVSDLGIVGAVNRELEVRLGSRTGKGDTFTLKERGPGIEALAGVLDRYLEQYPGDILLSKWLDDACRAAEIIYEEASMDLPLALEPRRNLISESDGSEFIEVNSDSEVELMEVDNQPKKSTNTTRKKPVVQTSVSGKKKSKKTKARTCAATQRPSTKVLESFDDEQFSDVEEEEDMRAGGAKVEPLLLEVTRPCFRRSKNGEREDGKRARCIASSACGKSWTWPRHQQRVLVHAVSCGSLSQPIRRRARELLAAKGSKSSSSISSRRKRSADSPESDVEAAEDVDEAETADNPSQSTKSSRSLKRLRTSSSTTSSIPDTFDAFVKKGSKETKDSGDHALTLFLVGCGIPPTVVDSGFFKHFVNTIQPKYQPPSSTTICDRLIPNEASKLHVELIKKLQGIRHLTLSFDGGKIRKPRGVYTVTVTTPLKRKSYIVNLNDVSFVSHTADFLADEVLEPVVEEVHPENVSAIVSDNTGNTRKARELVTNKYPHILNLQDCCHEMNLSLLQINELDEFQDMLQDVKQILTYMHHSTYAMEHFNNAREELKIKKGLTHIGTTRFWTYVSAVESVYEGLPAFREIVANDKLKIDIASRNELFEKHSVEAHQFEIQLVKYLAVTTPFARAIRCLESATTTVADVYAFWLGIMSRLEYIMSNSSRTGLTTRTKEDIRAIANQRFNELIEDGQEDIYVTALFLDPRYRNTPVIETGNINPLSIPAIRIERGATGAHAVVASSTTTGRDELIARVGIYLQGLLLREYGGEEMVDRKDIQQIMKTRHPLLAPFSPDDALHRLKTELLDYAKSRDPFERPLRPGETTLEWWRRTQKDQHGHVLGALAIKIFSVVPHSMADERAMSFITWMNAARRNAQQVHTIEDHLKIRQHYLNEEPERFANAAALRRRRQAACVRRWCDLAADMRSAPDLDNTGGGEDGPCADTLTSANPTEMLRAGATVGGLNNERRASFVAGDHFDLHSQFLREMLADDIEVVQAEQATSSSTRSHAAKNPAAGNASTKSIIRPSQLEWNKWSSS